MKKTGTPLWIAGISAVASVVVLLSGAPAQAAADEPARESVVCPASLMWDVVAGACR
ncbi:hypothetical protein [Kitasatospora cineracea]|uniref:Secreted protein n=1 Tax=Kitasatospora cineracea TaxID=88074 RepID=A0A8G1UGT0_9ACTN|nr:hypothetical protein [Kitasatospora cineracea]ROR43690.1 hypothetical protein EDD39_1859 [Kitasatospora cineracea]